MVTATESYAKNIVSPALAYEAIKQMILMKEPTMLWGPMGVGKSQIIKQVTEDLGLEYIDVRALLMDPVDLRGFPYRDPDTNQMKWAIPDWLPQRDGAEEHPGWVIVFEELPAAPQMVQNALYSLILDRYIGEYVLPENVAMVACGNRESDKAGVTQMQAPLADRFWHLTLEPDMDEWQRWGLDNDINMDVLFFLKFSPDYLFDFDPRSKDPAFPTPRSWEAVSRLLNNANGSGPDLLEALIRGRVGEAAASDFTDFLALKRQIPLPASVINDPTNCMVPEGPAMIVLAASLPNQVREDIPAADAHFEAICTYADRFSREEVAQFLVGQCVAVNPQMQYTRAFIRWETTHQ